MRIKLILIAFFTSITICFSQNNLAKLEYMEAESSYSSKNYKESLEHIGNVKELLGQSNSKIIALEILAKEGLLVKENYSDFDLLKENYTLTTNYINTYGETVSLNSLKPIYKLSKKYKNILNNLNTTSSSIGKN